MKEDTSNRTASFTNKTVKKPIQRSFVIRSIIIFIILGVSLAVFAYIALSKTLYDNYNTRINNLIGYVEANIDADDLENCLKTGEHSEKYDELQQFLNVVIDHFGLTYLYICIPSDEGMINSICATSEEERAAGEEDIPLLFVTDAYSAEELARYSSYWNTEGINYFEESSDYGAYYTGVKALRNSKGETISLICADISAETVHTNLRNLLIYSIIIAVVFIGLFAVFMIIWLRNNVTVPLDELERSAHDFADRSHRIKNIDMINFEMPDINTKNEVQSLAETINKMASDINDYVKEIISTEKRANDAEIERLKSEREYEHNLLIEREKANIDALTGVKNKHAYVDIESELNEKIYDKEPLEFAITVFDINELKTTNDTYGHRVGDDTIKKASKIICDIFDHSPVFRIGGDEFAVISQGRDYEMINELIEKVAKINAENAEKDDVLIACGMAKYEGDRSVASLFERADKRMYQNKKKLKNEL